MRTLPLLLSLAACKDAPVDSSAPTGAADGYVVGSVVITPDGRTTYFQVLDSLDQDALVTNEHAIEAPGNGVVLARGSDVFLGLAESPEWVKYSVGEDGRISETGRLSLANHGFSFIDYGYAIIHDDLAVSVSTEGLVAVFWNPTTMEIVGSVDLPHLAVEGYGVEVWTTVGHDGKVYIPARWTDWSGGRVLQRVSTTILDAESQTLLGVAEDERCSSGGRVVFSPDGYAYVQGDGRNYSSTMFENAGGAAAPPNCLLRIAPGETDFDEDFYVETMSLTGGYESVTELEVGEQGTGVAFTWLFYEEDLPEDVEPVDFTFWGYPVFRLWRVDLGDAPSATPIPDMPPAVLGFTGSAVEGRYYIGNSADGSVSTVYEVDPADNSATPRFEMEGYLYGLYRLGG
ncbi:MAG: hypothetical protein H6741_06815 [Alphaproteobacteria bacterium]|nr:hypothetical protein [Alphaproteobacteria bacterium]MCB9792424.1 hypothetical protein [Alphaproteobacteria bacterium]